MMWLFLFLFQAFTCTLELQIDDHIGVGTLNYLEEAEETAIEKGCTAKLLKINTPGGDLQATRKIVQIIMNSPQPYLCLVYPSGGHAGSAGAIILQACHVSGAMKATNLGAATPVQSTGQEMPEDLRKKILNDTVSWLEGITKVRGRNLQFSKDIITEAKAVSATEAEEVGAIDIAANSVKEFLDFAIDREVTMGENKSQKVVVGAVEKLEPSLRYHVLQIFANPQLAYFIFLGSLGLLYFEFTNPGAIIPGVVGGIGLIVSLISFHALDVQWGGVALIILGILFFILEMLVPSFGALGIGGIIAFALGGIFMYESGSYYEIPMFDVILSSLFLGLILFGISYLAYQAQRRKKHSGLESAIGETATVENLNEDKKSGHILWRGERWRFESERILDKNEKVEIIEKDGFTFKVKKS